MDSYELKKEVKNAQALRLKEKEMTLRTRFIKKSIKREEEDGFGVRLLEKEGTIEQEIVRHGRTLYARKRHVVASCIENVQGEIGFFYPENYQGSIKRYRYIATQIAAFPAVFTFMLFPEQKTMGGRLIYMLLCVAIWLPLMWLLAGLASKLRLYLCDQKEAKRAPIREKVECELAQKLPDASFWEMKAALVNQLALIHFSGSKEELKSYGCQEPGSLLVKYGEVCDGMVGVIHYGMMTPTKWGYTIPMRIQYHMLVSNGKNLVPKTEYIELVMEKTQDFRIVSYRNIGKRMMRQ